MRDGITAAIFNLNHPANTVQAAAAKTQAGWTTAYEASLSKASTTPSGAISVSPGSYGPLPTMLGSLLTFAESWR